MTFARYLLVFCMLLVAPRAHAAEEGAIGLGARMDIWRGQQRQAPGIGGHLRLQPWKWTGLELFWDSFGRKEEIAQGGQTGNRESALWHTHVIGFHLLFPLLNGAKTQAGPDLGACVAVEAWSPSSTPTPGIADLRFAPHLGLFLDHSLSTHWALGARATGFMYMGNRPQIEGWSATSSNRLHIEPTLQLTGSLTRWF